MSVTESAIPADDHAGALSESGAPEGGACADAAVPLGWLERVLDDVLPLRGQHPSPWATRAQRLLRLTEIDDVLSTIETGPRADMPAAVLRHRFE